MAGLMISEAALTPRNRLIGTVPAVDFFGKSEPSFVQSETDPEATVPGKFLVHDEEGRAFCSIERALDQDNSTLLLRYIWQKASRVHTIELNFAEEVIDFLRKFGRLSASCSVRRERTRPSIGVRLIRAFAPLFGFSVQDTLEVCDNSGNEIGKLHIVLDQYAGLQEGVAFIYLMDESISTHFLNDGVAEKLLHYFQADIN